MKANPVTMVEDGRRLVGTTWVRPTDWQDDDQADDQSTHFLRNDFPIFQP